MTSKRAQRATAATYACLAEAGGLVYRLAAADRTARADRARSIAKAPSTRGALSTVSMQPVAIVVDDDPLVRRAIARQLATSFKVFLAGTLSNALNTLDQIAALGPSAQLQLAIIDFELPDGTGLPILERLEAWPDSIRLLMSANVVQLSQFRPCGRLVPLVLAKPLSFESIEAAKHAALAFSRCGEY